MMLVSTATSKREAQHGPVEGDLGLVGNRVGRDEGEDCRQPRVGQRGADHRRRSAPGAGSRPAAAARAASGSRRAPRARSSPAAVRWLSTAAGSRRSRTRSAEAARRRRTAPRCPVGSRSGTSPRRSRIPTRQLSGNSAGSRAFRSATIGRRSASACASVTPGFSRPSRWTDRTPSIRRPRSNDDREVDVGAAPHESLRHDADDRAAGVVQPQLAARARSGRRRTAAARTDSRERPPALRPAGRPRRSASGRAAAARPSRRRY